jgi:hydrogenase maturation protein HypF
MATRTQILVRGIVQGVGFRPYVFGLASRGALRGRVLNNTSGVLIDLEGDSGSIEQFFAEFKLNPPPLSSIDAVERNDNLDLANYQDFRIVESPVGAGERSVPISADVATCDDCLRELSDPRDRRYRYPFINCTNCGPRFTIVEDIPYDRSRTTMRDFPLCESCHAEYEDPTDRRFHAEPTACPECGPALSLLDGCGNRVRAESLENGDEIAQVRRLLLDGKIVAIKGIGGFHLACDGTNAAAVERLRQRKYREDKPFALMASSLEMVGEYCVVSAEEERLLSDVRRPIVLLTRKSGSRIPASVAPGVNALGFMLPYTPLHHLLLLDADRPLVMTSGNLSDEPISYETTDATLRLHHVADYFLTHDRRIHMRTDDSVVRRVAGRDLLLRRSRGYAPAPIKTEFRFVRQILACGAEVKNTFCLTRGHHAFVSHHIGDLENLETLRSFTEGIAHFQRLFQLEPEVVAYDLHPEYLSTKYGLGLDQPGDKVGVQHHHAHIASCLADNAVEGEVIGVAMDGTGFGLDGRLWGGEFFVADMLDAERVAQLDYVPMPGGAQAIREPWRMAAAYLQRAFGDGFMDIEIPSVKRMDRRAVATLRRMIETGTNCPETSSMGRLFDAIAGILDLRDRVNYEGQAAIELEGLANRSVAQYYEFEFASGVIKAEPVVRRAVEDLLDGAPPSVISAKFHRGVIHLIKNVALQLREERNLNRVALSGGVFQNVFLLDGACRELGEAGFEVFSHRRVPANDGGISLGQAAVANARLVAGRV